MKTISSGGTIAVGAGGKVILIEAISGTKYSVAIVYFKRDSSNIAAQFLCKVEDGVTVTDQWWGNLKYTATSGGDISIRYIVLRDF